MESETKSQTNILHLPDEILFQVMKSSGFCSNAKDNIRLVCKRFYKVYCAFTSCGLTFTTNMVNTFPYPTICKLKILKLFVESHSGIT